VTGRADTDDLARRDAVALDHSRLDGLDRDEQGACPDRHEWPIDDDAGEVHDAARRRAHGRAVRGRREVDPAVTRAVGGRRGEEGAQDDARPVHRPGPRTAAARHRFTRPQGAGALTTRDQERDDDAGEQRTHGGEHGPRAGIPAEARGAGGSPVVCA